MTAPIPDEFPELVAEKFRSLADPTRLAILRLLMKGERNVSRLVEGTGKKDFIAAGRPTPLSFGLHDPYRASEEPRKTAEIGPPRTLVRSSPQWSGDPRRTGGGPEDVDPRQAQVRFLIVRTETSYRTGDGGSGGGGPPAALAGTFGTIRFGSPPAFRNSWSASSR